MVLFTRLTNFHAALIIEEIVHLGILIIHLGALHLILCDRLVLELLQAKVLLVSRTHVIARHELLLTLQSVISCGRILLLHGDLLLESVTVLHLLLLLSLARELLSALLPCLRVIVKPSQKCF